MSLKVIETGAIQKLGWCFLFAFYSKPVGISWRCLMLIKLE